MTVCSVRHRTQKATSCMIPKLMGCRGWRTWGGADDTGFEGLFSAMELAVLGLVCGGGYRTAITTTHQPACFVLDHLKKAGTTIQQNKNALMTTGQSEHL